MKGKSVLSFVSNTDNSCETDNVENEISTSMPAKMNGEESILFLDAEEKEELTKGTDVLTGDEEEEELANKEVNSDKNANEEETKGEIEDEKQAKANCKNKVETSKKGMEANDEENVGESMNEDKMEGGKGVKSNSKKANLSRKRGKKGKVNEQNANGGGTKENVKIEKQVNPGSNEPIVLIGGEEVREHTQEEVINHERANDELKKEKVKDKVVQANSKSKVDGSKNMRKRGKKKMALRGMGDVIAKNANIPETSDKRITKVVKSAGMIFMCSSKTKNDCYHYKILGLPAGKRDIVLKIYEGMKLFLFDFDLKMLYGIYEAAGPGGYNIEPKAFKSAFPSQVRFNIFEDCLPLPEEKFRKAIKDNYYWKNKFDCQLTSEQVKNLCKLFRATIRDTKSKRLHGSSRTKKHTFAGHGGNAKRHFRAETHKSAEHHRPSKRQREQERYHTFGRDRLNIEGRNVRRREAYASRVASPPLHPPLPPPLAATLPLPYAYEGTLEMNVFRRDPLIEPQDRRFRDLELRRQEQIVHRSHSPHEHRDAWVIDSELRRRDNIEHRDRYMPYRDRPSYRDTAYSAARESEYHPRAGPSLRLRAQPLASQYGRQPVYRY